MRYNNKKYYLKQVCIVVLLSSAEDEGFPTAQRGVPYPRNPDIPDLLPLALRLGAYDHKAQLDG